MKIMLHGAPHFVGRLEVKDHSSESSECGQFPSTHFIRSITSFG
jgi:hypothetical protein